MWYKEKLKEESIIDKPKINKVRLNDVLATGFKEIISY